VLLVSPNQSGGITPNLANNFQSLHNKQLTARFRLTIPLLTTTDLDNWKDRSFLVSSAEDSQKEEPDLICGIGDQEELLLRQTLGLAKQKPTILSSRGSFFSKQPNSGIPNIRLASSQLSKKKKPPPCPLFRSCYRTHKPLFSSPG